MLNQPKGPVRKHKLIVWLLSSSLVYQLRMTTKGVVQEGWGGVGWGVGLQLCKPRTEPNQSHTQPPGQFTRVIPSGEAKFSMRQFKLLDSHSFWQHNAPPWLLNSAKNAQAQALTVLRVPNYGYVFAVLNIWWWFGVCVCVCKYLWVSEQERERARKLFNS